MYTKMIKWWGGLVSKLLSLQLGKFCSSVWSADPFLGPSNSQTVRLTEIGCRFCLLPLGSSACGIHVLTDLLYFLFKILMFTGLSNLGNTYVTKMCHELSTPATLASHHTYFIKYNGNGLLGNTAPRQNQVNV